MLFELRQHGLEDSIHILNHVVVPEAQSAIAMIAKPLVANYVAFVLGMLSAIDFNGKAEARTIEVKRKWSDRVLPSEMKTVELITAKCTP